MLVDTIFTIHCPWKSRTCSRKQPKNNPPLSLSTCRRKWSRGYAHVWRWCFWRLVTDHGGLHVLLSGTALDRLRPIPIQLLQEHTKIRFKGKGGHAASTPSQRRSGCASYFVTQPVGRSRNVDLSRESLRCLSLEQLTVIATVFLHGTIRALHILVWVSWFRNVKATLRRSCCLIWMWRLSRRLFASRKQPWTIRELMTFFDEKEGIEPIDIEPAMTVRTLVIFIKGSWSHVLLGIDSPYALHHPKMSPGRQKLWQLSAVSLLAKKAAEYKRWKSMQAGLTRT